MSEPRLYFDSAASTPLRPEVWEAMQPYFREKYGNPGSLHSFGQEAIRAVDESREKIAKALGVDFRQIIFTSSATEANNLALLGPLQAFKEKNPVSRPRLLISAVEHESVLEPAREMKKWGVDVIYLPVDSKGRVMKGALQKVLSPETFLVSIMYANNETGTVEEVEELVKIVKNYDSKILFHTDAAQAFGYLDICPKEIGTDMLTISSHKIPGPKGAAALFINDQRFVRPALYGGGQEFGMRSGTENVPALVGFGRAVEIAVRDRKEAHLEVLSLAERFLGKTKEVYNVSVNGEELNEPLRLPHILNLHFPGKHAETFLTQLDLKGIAASSGSACRSRAMSPSHVLQAMGLPPKRIEESIRVSFHQFLEEKDIDRGVKIIGEILSNERKI
jgi:cysteine desulfurase